MRWRPRPLPGGRCGRAECRVRGQVRDVRLAFDRLAVCAARANRASHCPVSMTPSTTELTRIAGANSNDIDLARLSAPPERRWWRSAVSPAASRAATTRRPCSRRRISAAAARRRAWGATNRKTSVRALRSIPHRRGSRARPYAIFRRCAPARRSARTVARPRRETRPVVPRRARRRRRPERGRPPFSRSRPLRRRRARGRAHKTRPTRPRRANAARCTSRSRRPAGHHGHPAANSRFTKRTPPLDSPRVPRSGARPRAAHRTLRIERLGSIAFSGVDTLIAPTTSPLASKSGAAILAMPASKFEWLIDVTAFAIGYQRRHQRLERQRRAFAELRQRPAAEVFLNVGDGLVGQNDAAHRGRMRRNARADGDHRADRFVCGETSDVDHLSPVENSEMRRTTRLGAEPLQVGPRQFGDVLRGQERVAERHHPRPEPVVLRLVLPFEVSRAAAACARGERLTNATRRCAGPSRSSSFHRRHRDRNSRGCATRVRVSVRYSARPSRSRRVRPSRFGRNALGLRPCGERLRGFDLLARDRFETPAQARDAESC